MKKTQNKPKKLPYGHCIQIAEIVGVDKAYVSKVLSYPNKYNGKKANQVKEYAQKIDEFKENLKASVLEAQSQN